MQYFTKSIIVIITMASLLVASSAISRTLRVGWPATAVSAAYPFSRDDGGGIRYAIYDALTWIDINGVLHPRLAVSWENESPTTWVFKLREGVVFNNGEPFNAEKVVRALDIFFDPDILHPRQADTGKFKSYRARGPYELEISTLQPDPIFHRRVSLLPIIEPKAWMEKGQDVYAKEPIGTGPYKVTSWGGNNTRPVLEHVPTSWREIGNVDRVEIIIVTDPGARVAGGLSGQLDYIASVVSDDFPTLRLAGFKIHKLNSPNILSLAFRTVRDDPSPLKDARVRRALNHAVDKTSIAEIILGGDNRVVHQPAAPGLIGYDPNVIPFDYSLEKAKALLAEAGYEDGFSLKFAVYGGLLANDTLIFQKIAQDFRAIGIPTEMRQISFPDYVRRLFNADWDGIDGFSMGWLHNTLYDPQRAIDQFSCVYSAPFYCDEDLMPLINAARIEMNPTRRSEMLTKVISTLSKSGAALWLIDFSGSVAFDQNIEIGDFRLDGTMFEAMTFNGKD